MELFVGRVFVWARRCSEIRLAPFTTTGLRTRRRTEERPVMATFIIDELTTVLRLAWERLRRRAGIFEVRFNDLRYEADSRFFERGLNVYAVQQFMPGLGQVLPNLR